MLHASAGEVREIIVETQSSGNIFNPKVPAIANLVKWLEAMSM